MDLRRSSSSSALTSTATSRRRWPPNSAQILSQIEDYVSNLYYKYGLMCSRHPILVIVLTLVIVSICCYPITGLRYLLGSSSQKFMTTLDNTYLEDNDNVIDIDSNSLPETDRFPDWFESNLSYAYVQQIVVKSSVIPWKDNLILMDAIRAPLSQVFKLTESVSNYQYLDGQTSQSLNNYCFQVSEPIAKIDKQSATYLPTFSCLMLSPANIWQNDINKFIQDSTIIKTMYSIKDLASPHSSGSLRDILFGVPWMETGIKRLYVRTRQRTITFAITIVFSQYNQQYIDGLTAFLKEKYPLDPTPDEVTNHTDNDDTDQQSDGQTLTHLYFQNKFTFTDLMPLLATYFLLFLYIYFSVRKIDLIKNKWALALASVLTVIMSLLMSLGICLRFGFNPTLHGTHILPYIVAIIGLENMLVLTKSVVSTPAHLDIKVRVAQGLSREGWSITKNLMTEITLLTFGFFTFMPIIQKLCLFATVGLLTDFFIQITFFATVLSVDIQRIELNSKAQPNGHMRSQSHSRHNSSADVNGLLSFGNRSYPQNVFARPAKPSQLKMPKRLRVVYFVARTRLVQRFLMLVLVSWIGFLVYNFGIVEHFGADPNNYNRNSIIEPNMVPNTQSREQKTKLLLQTTTKRSQIETKTIINQTLYVAQSHRLSHTNPNLWRQLSTQHWSGLFNYYNISLSGKFITILPPILLSIPVEPGAAIQSRNPSESDPQIFRQFLSPPGLQGLDPNDDNDNYDALYGDAYPHIPLQWTTAEIFITVALSVPSIIFIIYIFVVMYKCMCTRNYAEWRDSWAQTFKFGKSQANKKVSTYDFLEFETNPIRLQDHEQELNILASNTDTPFVASICMNGDIRIWDVLSGECHTLIKRLVTENQSVKKLFQPTHKPSGSFSSDSTYGSSPGTSNECLIESTNCFEHNVISSEHNSGEQSLLSNRRANGYNFTPHMSHQSTNSSQNILTELILNAAVNSEDVSETEFIVNHRTESSLPFDPIWCSEIIGKLIIVGCRDGRLEVWDALTGELCFYSDENKSGVTVVRATNTRLVVSRLNGTVEIYKLEIINGFSVSISSSTTPPTPHPAKGQVIRYNLLHSFRAHLQPITALQIESSNIITGGLDHVLKVFRSDTANCVFTLHGHCGGITAIHIDQYSPSTAISGCQVGQLCVWDVLTGTCVFSLEAHLDASVTALIATPLYFISSGTDNRICIWDKYSGHLVHTIQNHHSICKELLLLTPNILVTAREDHLVLWDISEASPVRIVELDSNCDKQNYIKNLRLSSQSRAVVCDYGKQLCVIHFPSVSEKSD